MRTKKEFELKMPQKDDFAISYDIWFLQRVVKRISYFIVLHNLHLLTVSIVSLGKAFYHSITHF